MMDEHPAPAWLEWTIRFVQGDHAATGDAMVAVAGALALMMAIGMLVAWQVG